MQLSMQLRNCGHKKRCCRTNFPLRSKFAAERGVMFIIEGRVMNEVEELQIKCLNCNTWFPSPIFFGDLVSFDKSSMEGNTVQCPNCNKMTSCNKENMRVRASGGGFVGNKTV